MYVRGPGSRRMAGLEVADGQETKLGPVVFTLSRDRREHEPEVVARIYAVNDLANKPPGTFGEHDGASSWPRLPRAKRELVDVVTCLFTEKPSQTDIGSPKRVEDYQIGCGRDVECPVELRDAHVPAQRTNAALRSEAHEAAGPAFIARYCEHVHRVVQMGDETTVGFLVLAVQFGSYPVHDASVLLGLLYVLILPFPVLSSILFAACSSRWKMVSVPTPVGPSELWPSG